MAGGVRRRTGELASGAISATGGSSPPLAPDSLEPAGTTGVRAGETTGSLIAAVATPGPTGARTATGSTTAAGSATSRPTASPAEGDSRSYCSCTGIAGNASEVPELSGASTMIAVVRPRPNAA